MINVISKILWAVSTALILLVGLFFTYKFNFVQFHFKKILNSCFMGKKTDGISPLSSLMMVLAGRIGVGSIAGVALAIYIGGAGSILWMWFISLITASCTFLETVLGNKYKEKDYGNIYKGGPAYYIKNGLNNYKLGWIYSFFIIISYIGAFLSIQSNTITRSINDIVYVPNIVVAIAICLFTGIIILGGIKKISSVTNKLVPLMIVLYSLTAIYITFKNINILGHIMYMIISTAFNFKPFLTGFLSSFIVGVQRGIFASEAGLGTGSIASSTTSDNNAIKNGYLQILGIYITSFIICTSTAFIILASDYTNLNLNDINGIEITLYAFNYHLGSVGRYIVFISIILFSFSTILTGYYYAESSIKYMKNKISNNIILILKITTIIMLFIGSLLSAHILWKLVDIFVAILIIINSISLFLLSDKIKYEMQKDST